MKDNNENALITEQQEDSLIIPKPLSESEVIDLMIYGEDVIDFGVSLKPITEKKYAKMMNKFHCLLIPLGEKHG